MSDTVELELLFHPNATTIGRLTLSECIDPGEPCVEPCLALCLCGIHESPEVYLTAYDADRLAMVLMRFIVAHTTTPDEEKARAARLREWLEREGYGIAHAAADKARIDGNA